MPVPRVLAHWQRAEREVVVPDVACAPLQRRDAPIKPSLVGSYIHDQRQAVPRFRAPCMSMTQEAAAAPSPARPKAAERPQAKDHSAHTAAASGARCQHGALLMWQLLRCTIPQHTGPENHPPGQPRCSRPIPRWLSIRSSLLRISRAGTVLQGSFPAGAPVVPVLQPCIGGGRWAEPYLPRAAQPDEQLDACLHDPWHPLCYGESLARWDLGIGCRGHVNSSNNGVNASAARLRHTCDRDRGAAKCWHWSPFGRLGWRRD